MSTRTEEPSYVVLRTIDIDGEPFLMRYNPPWTLPFLRRNEAAAKVKLYPDAEG